MMRPSHRVLAVVVLVVLLFGLNVHYAATYEENWPYPSSESLAESPGAYDGERVLIFGEVVEVELANDQLVMQTFLPDGSVAVEITVREFTGSVQPGGVVQIYGELAEDHTVQYTESYVVVNESPADELFKWITAVLGGLLAAGAFLSQWRINWRSVSFEVRHG